MYNTSNWVSIKSALSDFFIMADDSVLPESDLLELASIALQEITTFKIFEYALCFADVCNYKATIPRDYSSIEFVMYRKDSSATEELTYIKTLTTKCENCVTYESGSVTLTKFAFTDYISCQSCTQGWKFLPISWTPLDRYKSKFYLCEYSPSLLRTCNDSFSPNPDGTITTTFEEGKVLYAYRKYPRDENGDFLIPDIPEIKRAIKAYLFMSYWQKLSFKDDQGAHGKYKDYAREWELAAANARGRQILSDANGYIKMAKDSKLMKEGSPFDIWINTGYEHFKTN